MVVKEWDKLGYTEEQCRELEKLSVIGNEDIKNDDVNIASEILSEAMKEYQSDGYEVEKIIDEFNKIPN